MYKKNIVSTKTLLFQTSILVEGSKTFYRTQIALNPPPPPNAAYLHPKLAHGLLQIRYANLID